MRPQPSGYTVAGLRRETVSARRAVRAVRALSSLLTSMEWSRKVARGERRRAIERPTAAAGRGEFLPTTDLRYPYVAKEEEMQSKTRALSDRELEPILRSLPSSEGSEWERRLQFAMDVDKGLSGSPRALDCRYLYDARGSELFEEICEQPEYYPTRTEEAILSEHAASIAEETGPVAIMELGAGTSRKTQHLLRAYCDAGLSPRYLTVDVSHTALDKGAERIERQLPAVRSYPICTTYEAAFPILPYLGRTMLTFLGSTVGNFEENAFQSFFHRASRHLSEGDYLLLGVDLHKDTGTLEAAYNDAAGVTAEFTRNLFGRINRELGASIDLDAVVHQASYNAEERQVEISARFSSTQEIRIAPLCTQHRVEAGERIRTEVSRKFTLEHLGEELDAHGLSSRRVFSDSQRWFAVLLLERTTSSSRESEAAT